MWILLFQIFLVLLPAIMLLVELSGSTEGKFRRTRLTVATLMLVGSVTWTIVDHFTTEASNQERTADLRTIQILSSSLIDLCFEFELIEVDTSLGVDVDLQIRTWVNTVSSTTGIFANYFTVTHSPDSGWYVSSATFEGHKSIGFELTKDKRYLRFVISNFGVATAGVNKRIGWKPINIADLGSVKFELQAMPSIEGRPVDDFDKEWCSIHKVRMYANTFDIENLLVVAEWAPGYKNIKYDNWRHFLPKWQKGFSNPDTREFRIEPIGIREVQLNIAAEE